MRFVVKQLVWITLLLYLLSGFGSAFGATWCLAGEEGCGPGLAASSCRPAATWADGLRAVDRHVACLDVELQFPTLKSRLRAPRPPVFQLPLMPAFPPAVAVLSPGFPPFSPGLDEPRPLLAQRQLRTVVLLN